MHKHMQHRKQAGRIIVLHELAEWQHCWNSWDMVSKLAWLEPCSVCVEALQESHGGRRRKEAAPLWKSDLNVWSSDTGDRVAESSWVMVPQKASMDDNMVGPCYSPPDEGKEGCKGFSKQLKEISDWQTGTQGNFWHLLERQCSNSGSQEDFWAASGTTSSHRLPDAPVRADVQLRLLLTNREGLDGDMVTNGCLGCSDQETAPDPESGRWAPEYTPCAFREQISTYSGR